MSALRASRVWPCGSWRPASIGSGACSASGAAYTLDASGTWVEAVHRERLDAAYLRAEAAYLAPPEPDDVSTQDDDSPLHVARAVERILAEAVTFYASAPTVPKTASGIVWDASAGTCLDAPVWATDEAIGLLADTAVRLAATPAA